MRAVSGAVVSWMQFSEMVTELLSRLFLPNLTGQHIFSSRNCNANLGEILDTGTLELQCLCR
jgi:hypothetical protein